MNKLAIFVLLCVCACLGYAASPTISFTKSQLYQAYLKNDMRVWNGYLHATSFDNLSKTDKIQYLNYEYGYLAVAVEEDVKDVEQHLQNFEAHINALVGILPEATILTYRSSLAAYKAMHNKWTFASNGMKSVQLVEQAYALDSMNPLVLTLKANVDFYAPRAFGGNKKRAIEYFLRAERLYVERGDTLQNWDLTATRLCLVQCYQKIGKIDMALQRADEMLRRDPNFVFLRDELYPELKKSKAKKSK